MKKLTVKEVMEALQNNMSLEPDYDGTLRYYLHITDEGKIVNDHARGDESFNYPYYGVAEDDSFDWEVESNEDFMKVVKELTEQANEFLKEWGE